MDSFHNTNNFNKPSPNRTRSNGNFSHAAVVKSDVGDFQEGYFVMAEMPPVQRHKSNKTPERTQRKNDYKREGDIHVSNVRLPTSPTRSPTRNSKRNLHTSPQQTPHQTHMNQPTQSLSPYKPRKAHHEKRPDNFSLETISGSPPKEKGPSPPPTRWAGPAFSNAPPPSSLPMPEFPPFQQDAPSVSSPIPPSSPVTSFAPIYPQPQFFNQPPLYAPIAYPAAYTVQLSYADVPSQPQNLAQLSTDLRRMLNISQPISA